MEQKHYIEKIQNARSITDALHALEQEEKPTPLPVLLSNALAQQNLPMQELARRIDVERSTLYRLLSGERLTTRNVLLRIALALHFSVEETQTLLRAGRRAQLYAPVRRDAILLFCLSRGETLELTEAVLQQRGCDSLYERL